MTELKKELQEVKAELQGIRECLEPLKKVCKGLNKPFPCGNTVIPVDSGLTGNEIREIYGMKRIQEALCDKVLISQPLYDSLMKVVEITGQELSIFQEKE